MYDHQTETLWSQLTGKAIDGPLVGRQLKMLAAMPKMRWQDWINAYPETQVLVVNGRSDSRYDSYEDYHRSGRTGLRSPQNRDRRVGSKDMVIGVVVDGHYKAYPFKAFRKTTTIRDEFSGRRLIVFYDEDSNATAVYDGAFDGQLLAFDEITEGSTASDSNTGNLWNLVTGRNTAGESLERIPHMNVYWFAWYDFHPETQLYKKDKD